MNIQEVSPDLYIEITSNSFKSSPNLVYQQDFLHDTWDTQRVYRLHPFQSGVYLLYDLHKNPHYQLPIEKRNEFNMKAKKKNIPVIDVSQPTFSKAQEFYHFSNLSLIHISEPTRPY